MTQDHGRFRQLIRKILYKPTIGTRWLNLRNAILSRACEAYYFRERRHSSDGLPLVADIGGIGKNQVGDLAGWGKVKVLTVNLYDDADINDDATTLEKIEENSLDGIYSSHLIEHLWWWKTADVLGVWYKKLKPRGRIELRCPDIEWIVKKSFEAYKNKKNSEVWEDILFHITYGPSIVPWHRHYGNEGQHHRDLLWEDRLKDKLHQAGFRKVRRIYYFKNGLDHWPYDITYPQFHGKILVRDLVMEGYKP